MEQGGTRGLLVEADATLDLNGASVSVSGGTAVNNGIVTLTDSSVSAKEFQNAAHSSLTVDAGSTIQTNKLVNSDDATITLELDSLGHVPVTRLSGSGAVDVVNNGTIVLDASSMDYSPTPVVVMNLSGNGDVILKSNVGGNSVDVANGTVSISMGEPDRTVLYVDGDWSDSTLYPKCKNVGPFTYIGYNAFYNNPDGEDIRTLSFSAKSPTSEIVFYANGDGRYESLDLGSLDNAPLGGLTITTRGKINKTSPQVSMKALTVGNDTAGSERPQGVTLSGAAMDFQDDGGTKSITVSAHGTLMVETGESAKLVLPVAQTSLDRVVQVKIFNPSNPDEAEYYSARVKAGDLFVELPSSAFSVGSQYNVQITDQCIYQALYQNTTSTELAVSVALALVQRESRQVDVSIAALEQKNDENVVYLFRNQPVTPTQTQLKLKGVDLADGFTTSVDLTLDDGTGAGTATVTYSAATGQLTLSGIADANDKKKVTATIDLDSTHSILYTFKYSKTATTPYSVFPQFVENAFYSVKVTEKPTLGTAVVDGVADSSITAQGIANSGKLRVASEHETRSLTVSGLTSDPLYDRTATVHVTHKTGDATDFDRTYLVNLPKGSDSMTFSSNDLTDDTTYTVDVSFASEKTDVNSFSLNSITGILTLSDLGSSSSLRPATVYVTHNSTVEAFYVEIPADATGVDVPGTFSNVEAVSIAYSTRSSGSVNTMIRKAAKLDLTVEAKDFDRDITAVIDCDGLAPDNSQSKSGEADAGAALWLDFNSEGTSSTDHTYTVEVRDFSGMLVYTKDMVLNSGTPKYKIASSMFKAGTDYTVYVKDGDDRISDQVRRTEMSESMETTKLTFDVAPGASRILNVTVAGSFAGDAAASTRTYQVEVESGAETASIISDELTASAYDVSIRKAVYSVFVAQGTTTGTISSNAFAVGAHYDVSITDGETEIPKQEYIAKTLSTLTATDVVNSNDIEVDNADFIADSVVNDGTFTVSGYSRLDIDALSGTAAVSVADNGTLHDSTVTGGAIAAAGNMGFAGDNAMTGVAITVSAGALSNTGTLALNTDSTLTVRDDVTNTGTISYKFVNGTPSDQVFQVTGSGMGVINEGGTILIDASAYTGSEDKQVTDFSVTGGNVRAVNLPTIPGRTVVAVRKTASEVADTVWLIALEAETATLYVDNMQSWETAPEGTAIPGTSEPILYYKVNAFVNSSDTVNGIVSDTSAISLAGGNTTGYGALDLSGADKLTGTRETVTIEVTGTNAADIGSLTTGESKVEVVTSGDLNVNGAVTNNGTLTQSTGAMDVTSAFTNSGSFTQAAGSMNAASLANNAGSTMTLNGTMTVAGEVTNSGSFTQAAGSMSAASLTNNAGGTITVGSGELSTAGAITVSGAVTNSGSITLGSGSSFKIGTETPDPSYSFTGSPLTNNAGGTITIDASSSLRAGAVRNKGDIAYSYAALTDDPTTAYGQRFSASSVNNSGGTITIDISGAVFTNDIKELQVTNFGVTGGEIELTGTPTLVGFSGSILAVRRTTDNVANTIWLVASPANTNVLYVDNSESWENTPEGGYIAGSSSPDKYYKVNAFINAPDATDGILSNTSTISMAGVNGSGVSYGALDLSGVSKVTGTRETFTLKITNSTAKVDSLTTGGEGKVAVIISGSLNALGEVKNGNNGTLTQSTGTMTAAVLTNNTGGTMTLNKNVTVTNAITNSGTFEHTSGYIRAVGAAITNFGEFRHSGTGANYVSATMLTNAAVAGTMTLDCAVVRVANEITNSGTLFEHATTVAGNSATVFSAATLMNAAGTMKLHAATVTVGGNLTNDAPDSAPESASFIWDPNPSVGDTTSSVSPRLSAKNLLNTNPGGTMQLNGAVTVTETLTNSGTIHHASDVMSAKNITNEAGSITFGGTAVRTTGTITNRATMTQINGGSLHAAVLRNDKTGAVFTKNGGYLNVNTLTAGSSATMTLYLDDDTADHTGETAGAHSVVSSAFTNGNSNQFDLKSGTLVVLPANGIINSGTIHVGGDGDEAVLIAKKLDMSESGTTRGSLYVEDGGVLQITDGNHTGLLGINDGSSSRKIVVSGGTILADVIKTKGTSDSNDAGKLFIQGESTVAADSYTGNGWIVLDAATLNKDTKIVFDVSNKKLVVRNANTVVGSNISVNAMDVKSGGSLTISNDVVNETPVGDFTVKNITNNGTIRVGNVVGGGGNAKRGTVNLGVNDGTGEVTNNGTISVEVGSTVLTDKISGGTIDIRTTGLSLTEDLYVLVKGALDGENTPTLTVNGGSTPPEGYSVQTFGNKGVFLARTNPTVLYVNNAYAGAVGDETDDGHLIGYNAFTDNPDSEVDTTLAFAADASNTTVSYAASATTYSAVNFGTTANAPANLTVTTSGSGPVAMNPLTVGNGSSGQAVTLSGADLTLADAVEPATASLTVSGDSTLYIGGASASAVTAETVANNGSIVIASGSELEAGAVTNTDGGIAVNGTLAAAGITGGAVSVSNKLTVTSSISNVALTVSAPGATDPGDVAVTAENIISSTIALSITAESLSGNADSYQYIAAGLSNVSFTVNGGSDSVGELDEVMPGYLFTTKGDTGAWLVKAQSRETLYVDSSYTANGANDGLIYGWNAFSDLADALSAATSETTTITIESDSEATDVKNVYKAFENASVTIETINGAQTATLIFAIGKDLALTPKDGGSLTIAEDTTISTVGDKSSAYIVLNYGRTSGTVTVNGTLESSTEIALWGMTTVGTTGSLIADDDGIILFRSGYAAAANDAYTTGYAVTIGKLGEEEKPEIKATWFDLASGVVNVNNATVTAEKFLYSQNMGGNGAYDPSVEEFAVTDTIHKAILNSQGSTWKIGDFEADGTGDRTDGTKNYITQNGEFNFAGSRIDVSSNASFGNKIELNLSNSVMDIDGDLENAGAINLTDSAMQIDGSLENAGTIRIEKNTATDGSVFSVAGNALNREGALISINGSQFNANGTEESTLTNNGTIEVSGRSLLVIDTLTGNAIELLDGAIINATIQSGGKLNVGTHLVEETPVGNSVIFSGTNDMASTDIDNAGTITVYNTLSGGAIDNDGTITVNGTLSATGAIDNAGGTITVNGTLSATGAIDNDGGTILVNSIGATPAITATGIDNTSGTITIDATGFSTGTLKVIDVAGKTGLNVADIILTHAEDGVRLVQASDGDILITNQDQAVLYVKSTYSPTGENDGHIYGYNAFSSFQAAMDAAAPRTEATTITVLNAVTEEYDNDLMEGFGGNVTVNGSGSVTLANTAAGRMDLCISPASGTTFTITAPITMAGATYYVETEPATRPAGIWLNYTGPGSTVVSSAIDSETFIGINGTVGVDKDGSLETDGDIQVGRARDAMATALTIAGTGRANPAANQVSAKGLQLSEGTMTTTNTKIKADYLSYTDTENFDTRSEDFSAPFVLNSTGTEWTLKGMKVAFYSTPGTKIRSTATATLNFTNSVVYVDGNVINAAYRTTDGQNAVSYLADAPAMTINLTGSAMHITGGMENAGAITLAKDSSDHVSVLTVAGAITNEAGGAINITGSTLTANAAITNEAGAAIALTGSTLTAATSKVTNNGTFSVSGESTLDIGELDGTITVEAGATLAGSNIAGAAPTVSVSADPEPAESPLTVVIETKGIIHAEGDLNFTGNNALTDITLDAVGEITTDGTLTINAYSMITADSISFSGDGEVFVDATGFDLADVGGMKKVIQLNADSEPIPTSKYSTTAGFDLIYNAGESAYYLVDAPNNIIYVEKDWTASDYGTEVDPQKYYGYNAANNVNAAVDIAVQVRSETPSATPEIVVYEGAYSGVIQLKGISTTILKNQDEQAPHGTSFSSAIYGGEKTSTGTTGAGITAGNSITVETGNFSKFVVGGSNIDMVNTEDASKNKDVQYVINGTLDTETNRTVAHTFTITGGVFNTGIVAGGDRFVTGDFSLNGDINMFIDGGSFNYAVAGGLLNSTGSTGKGKAVVNGNVNLTITGGSFGDNCWIYGGCISTQKDQDINAQTEIHGDVTITVDSSSGNTINLSKMVVGSHGWGKIVRENEDDPLGNTKLVFTGDGSKITFNSNAHIWGGCSGDDFDSETFAVDATSVDSRRILSFTDFSGPLNCKMIRGFSDIQCIRSVVTLKEDGVYNFSDIGNWEFVYAEKADESLADFTGSFLNDFSGDTLRLDLGDWDGSSAWTILENTAESGAFTGFGDMDVRIGDNTLNWDSGNGFYSGGGYTLALDDTETKMVLTLA
ncbi:MAG: hypothetical protein IKQ16_07130 [Lentisphaeria bacterium]|nr:hypothetical protein [Lentisphaeria bacterium]